MSRTAPRTVALLTLGAVVALGAAGCDRGAKSSGPKPTLVDPPTVSPTASSSSSSAPAAVAPSCNLPAVQARHPAPKRLVAIGDIHGDLLAARAALRTAGAIDASDSWIGGDLTIVQTGDILDRGDDEQAIVDLFAKLEGEAAKAGGAVIVLNGNHELMNAAGDFRYVTPGAMHDFDEHGGDRLAALGPGGVYAKKFAQHNAIAIVGDTIFSHAGVLGDWVTQIDAVNGATRCYLDGQSKEMPAAGQGDDSPLWTRAVGLPDVDCSLVSAALGKLGLARMVVGHTVQQGGITSACGGALWRIDVGLAKLYGGPIQVLQVYPDAKILDGTRL